MTNPEIGEKVGPYEIRGLIGKGGMGAVYLAEDRSLDRRVALKMLPPQFMQDREIVARFRREAQALARLRHPNLMHIYAVGEHKGRPYFAMEYIKGSTLSSIIETAGRIAPAQAAHIAAEVMSALDKVHKARMMHRDVKPGNIMIDEDGRAVLMDFGLARQEQDSALTADHTVLGTPKYMSPEQAQGERVDSRTDIYSLGIVLYEMLTGRAPFTGKTSFEILRRHIDSSVPPPSELEPDVPPGLDAVVARAVAKSREDRYQNVREMATDLSAVYRDATLLRLAAVTGPGTEPTVTIAQPRPGFASTIAAHRPAPSSWRNLSVKIGGAAVAGVLAAALLAWLFSNGGQEQEPGPKKGPAAGKRRVRLHRKKKTPAGKPPASFLGALKHELVEIRHSDGKVDRGKLISIEVIDDGTTIAKIDLGESKGSRRIRIRAGDVLTILRGR